MAVEFNKLQFTKNWNSSADFPTYEENEQKVRADMQLLHDETRDFINESLIPGIENMAVPGTGDMLADVYDPQNKREDVFAYVDETVGALTPGSIGAASATSVQSHLENYSNPHLVTADQVPVTESVINAIKETGNWSVDGILTQFGNTMFGGEPLYRWNKTKTTITEEDYGNWTSTTKTTWDLYYSSDIVVNADNTITLVNYDTKSVNSATKFTIPEGSYCKFGSNSDTAKVYRATDDSVATLSTTTGRKVTNVKLVTGQKTTILLTSTDPNAYTDGYVDEEGFTYTALDPIMAFVPRIQTGSYTGTNTYGASNPCSLTFSFAPKFVVIAGINNGVYTSIAILTAFGGMASDNDTSQTYDIRAINASVEGNTISYYATSTAIVQHNASNFTYEWVAIG